MMPAQFPHYQSPTVAARWGCAHCHAPLDPQTLTDDNYPPGRGRYRMTCAQCGMSTWFDLKGAQ